MKLTNIIAITALLLGAANVRADVGLTITLNARITAQNTNSFTNPITQSVTVRAPVTRNFTTFELLRRLAVDETLAGRWTNNTFPPGSRLVTTNNLFLVVRGTNVLADVSDIISFNGGDNNIVSGSFDTNGLARPFPQNKIHIARITFDDTTINANDGLQFYLQGLMTETTVDTAPTRAGFFNEVHIANMPSAAGEGHSGVGSSDTRQIVISGSALAVGNGRLAIGP